MAPQAAESTVVKSRVPVELVEKARAQARNEDRTLANLIRRALSVYVASPPPPNEVRK